MRRSELSRANRAPFRLPPLHVTPADLHRRQHAERDGEQGEHQQDADDRVRPYASLIGSQVTWWSSTITTTSELFPSTEIGSRS